MKINRFHSQLEYIPHTSLEHDVDFWERLLQTCIFLLFISLLRYEDIYEMTATEKGRIEIAIH